MREPSVSVVLTTYNRAHVVGKTLDTILAQDYGDFELIISDNASSDGTEEVCRAYEAVDRRVRYFRNGRNLGMPGNLNAGIRRAQSEFVANLHDGDFYRSDLLGKWVAALRRHADAAFVFNQLASLDANGRFSHIRADPFRERIEKGELVRYMLSRFDSPVWGTVMARRAAYVNAGLFNERYSYIADVEMWMRLNLQWPVCYVPEPLIVLTQHEPDRPYARVNWRLERALVSMQEEIIEAFYPEAVEIAEARRDLRTRRDRRWLFLLASCIRRRRFGLAKEGLEVFAREDSALLRIASLARLPFKLVPLKLVSEEER